MSYIRRTGWTQFFIYFAWLCFGKAALDPFGEDDDDIDIKNLIQSHIEVRYIPKYFWNLKNIQKEFDDKILTSFHQNSARLKLLYNSNVVDLFPDLVKLLWSCLFSQARIFICFFIFCLRSNLTRSPCCKMILFYKKRVNTAQIDQSNPQKSFRLFLLLRWTAMGDFPRNLELFNIFLAFRFTKM